MTSVFNRQNSISLCPASFCTPRPNLPVTPGISWLPTFVFQSPIVKRTSSVVLVLKGLVGLHRTDQLQLLQRYWLGHRLGLLWYWMVCLGMFKSHDFQIQVVKLPFWFCELLQYLYNLFIFKPDLVRFLPLESARVLFTKDINKRYNEKIDYFSITSESRSCFCHLLVMCFYLWLNFFICKW